MIKISVAGDFVPINRMAGLDEGDYQKAFADVTSINQSCDYSVVNLECPIVLSEEKPIEKIGPNLKTDEKAIKMLQVAQFKCVTLSNNHFYDYGEKGVADTLDTLDKYGIDHFGGGRNIEEASKTFFKEIKGRRFAFINCSEREFATATEQTGGANPLDVITQYYAITEARRQADVVVIIVHGGMEQYPLPSPAMKKTYRFFIDAGADVVVNHHQHFHCGYEIYKNKPVFYGLGNFCFDHKDQRETNWNYGYMLTMSFDINNKVSFDIYPYEQCNSEPGVQMLKGEKEKSFLQRLDNLNQMIADDQRLRDIYSQYLSKTEDFYGSLLSPYTSKWAVAAYSKGWLPSFFPRLKRLALYDKIECDSHRERLLHFLRSNLKK